MRNTTTMNIVMKTIKFIALCVTCATINLTCSDKAVRKKLNKLNTSLQERCRPTRHSYVDQERSEKTTYHIGGKEVSQEEFDEGRQPVQPAQSEIIATSKQPVKQTLSETIQLNGYGNHQALEEICIEDLCSSYLDIDSDSDDEIEQLSEEEAQKITQEINDWFKQKTNLE